MEAQDRKEFAEELHKKFYKKYQRRPVIIKNGVNDVWSMDLVDFSEWEDDNDGMRFGLCIIDCFSRYAWMTPIKNKTGNVVLDEFKKVVNNWRMPPEHLWIDQGGEFINKDFKKYCKANNIIIYHTFSEGKAVMIEAFNKTIKTRIWKYFTEHQTRRWIDIIPKLIKQYNNSKHSAIGMSPKKALTHEGDVLLYMQQHQKEIKYVKPKLKVGDYVRIARIKGKFEKGYLPNWSTEVYKVSKIIKSNPVTYNINEWDGEPVLGGFYEAELQKTKQPDIFYIEETLATRTRNKKKEYLVKYLGWSDKYNSWVSEKDYLDAVK